MSRRKLDLPPNRVPFGSIKMLIQTLLEAGVGRYELDTEALGITDPYSYYNSCFQAAKRSGSFRVSKQGTTVIFVRNHGEVCA